MTFCSRYPFACAAAAVTVMTAALTWPTALHLATAFAAHQDAYFSTWRVGWIAHALATNPHHLFDGNILYPTPRTLAMSDATLFEGAISAPLFWAGMPPVAIYNLLLLGGIAASGLAMFVLARELTGRTGAALVAAAVFTMAPYRVEHYMHLELQWAPWIPLAFWSAHRTFVTRSWRFGLLTGVLVWLQLLSSIYYGAFLAMTLAVYCALLIPIYPRRAAAATAWLAAGAALAMVLVIPYARPYLENARELGPRDIVDVQRLSATIASYFAAPPSNLLWGWTADRFGAMELRLFPGLTALVLAAAGLAMGRAADAPDHDRRIVWLWAATLATAVMFSLGLNSPVYRWLYAHVWALGGFRAPSRFGIIVLCALGVLAAVGTAALERRLAGRVRAGVVVATLLSALTIEYWSAPMALAGVPRGVPELYRYVRGLPPGVIVELPLPRLETLPGSDPEYEYWSTTHWKPLINGYTGFLPPAYADTIVLMQHFPDTPSVERLRNLKVRYLIVHESLYTSREAAVLLAEMLQRPMLVPAGRYRDWDGWADVFELR